VKEMDLDRIRNLIIGFALVALIAAAGAIALYDFQTEERGKHITSVSNETVSHGGDLSQSYLYVATSACRNLTNQVPLALNVDCNTSSAGTVTVSTLNGTSTVSIDYTHYTPTYLMNITDSGLNGLDNTTSYFGTAGTIAGVALLLTIVIGAFYFITRRERA